MNLKHLLECYRYKNIGYSSITYEPDNRNIATIHFNDCVKAVCVSDSEKILNMNILISYNKKDNSNVLQAISILNIIACSIHCLSNISSEEEKIILKELGLYDGSFKNTKRIRHEDVLYKCGIINSILTLSIYKNF